MAEFEFGIVGEEILRCRRRRNMTQGELASRVGKSQSHISKIEKGQAYDWTTVQQICQLLDIPYQDLMHRVVGAPRTESAILQDDTLRMDDRTLLVKIYNAMQERGPFGKAIPGVTDD